jgi:hypothetical protein
LICPLYEHSNEEEWHFMLDCHDSKLAQQAAGLDGIISSQVQRFNIVKEVIMHICRYEDKAKAGRFAVLVWVLWNNRNDWVWNNEKEAEWQLGVKALCLWNK